MEFLKLGMGDWLTAVALWSTLVAVVIAIVYGVLNWNKEMDK